MGVYGLTSRIFSENTIPVTCRLDASFPRTYDVHAALIDGYSLIYSLLPQDNYVMYGGDYNSLKISVYRVLDCISATGLPVLVYFDGYILGTAKDETQMKRSLDRLSHMQLRLSEMCLRAVDSSVEITDPNLGWLNNWMQQAFLRIVAQWIQERGAPGSKIVFCDGEADSVLAAASAGAWRSTTDEEPLQRAVVFSSDSDMMVNPLVHLFVPITQIVSLKPGAEPITCALSPVEVARTMFNCAPGLMPLAAAFTGCDYSKDSCIHLAKPRPSKIFQLLQTMPHIVHVDNRNPMAPGSPGLGYSFRQCGELTQRIFDTFCTLVPEAEDALNTTDIFTFICSLGFAQVTACILLGLVPLPNSSTERQYEEFMGSETVPVFMPESWVVDQEQAIIKVPACAPEQILPWIYSRVVEFTHQSILQYAPLLVAAAEGRSIFQPLMEHPKLLANYRNGLNGCTDCGFLICVPIEGMVKCPISPCPALSVIRRLSSELEPSPDLNLLLELTEETPEMNPAFYTPIRDTYACISALFSGRAPYNRYKPLVVSAAQLYDDDQAHGALGTFVKCYAPLPGLFSRILTDEERNIVMQGKGLSEDTLTVRSRELIFGIFFGRPATAEDAVNTIPSLDFGVLCITALAGRVARQLKPSALKHLLECMSRSDVREDILTGIESGAACDVASFASPSPPFFACLNIITLVGGQYRMITQITSFQGELAFPWHRISPFFFVATAARHCTDQRVQTILEHHVCMSASEETDSGNS